MGLAMALTFNDPRIRGRKVLRTLFILPYAFPAFLSALLWRGMLNANADYGIVNRLFFFGARIEWLSDPWLAKLAILGVNLWLSFPYWFLVCTGALQSLPDDVLEAARIDGAGRWRTWRTVTTPLLLISTAPLIIASFAFNFNNFTIIYMLTGGEPRFTDTSAALGHTDILITMIYQISGVAGGRADFGLASALSIVVFLVVGGISALAFRRTRKLEEIL
jgi:arabinogalactan oligomer/maltooligosaccharide transport system permease protein